MPVASEEGGRPCTPPPEDPPPSDALLTLRALCAQRTLADAKDANALSSGSSESLPPM